MKWSTVLRPSGVPLPANFSGTSSMYMRFSGIPLFLAATRAVSSKVTQVKRALAPELFSWYSSSEALFAALAGVWMPPRRVVAHASGTVSIWQMSIPEPVRAFCQYTHSVYREDGDDFVPLGPLVRVKVKLLGQAPCEVVNTLLDLQGRVCLASQSTRERIARVTERMAAIEVVQDKLADRDRVGWVKRKLRHP